MTPIQFEAKYGAFSFSMLCSCCAATMFDDDYEDIITLLQQRFVFREIESSLILIMGAYLIRYFAPFVQDYPVLKLLMHRLLMKLSLICFLILVL